MLLPMQEGVRLREPDFPPSANEFLITEKKNYGLNEYILCAEERLSRCDNSSSGTTRQGFSLSFPLRALSLFLDMKECGSWLVAQAAYLGVYFILAFL